MQFFIEKRLCQLPDEKIVLLDMDDTINHFLERFWEIHYNVYGEYVDPTKINDWDLAKFTKRGSDVYDLLNYPGLYRELRPKEDVDAVIRNLEEKYNVFLVTDTPSGTSHCDVEKSFSNPTADKRKWVQQHFPFLDSSKMIFSSHKWLIQGDVLVDDKPQTFLEFQKRGRNVILADAPHNKHIETEFRACTVKEMEQMIDYLIDK